MESFVLGGGCFWCLDAVYQQIRGVSEVISGYAGGDWDNPTYPEVCTGNTGHAEVVKVVFDPQAISGDVILDIFFSIHDPCQLNRQNNDVGTQYRSVMLYQDETQRKTFENARESAKKEWGSGVVTAIAPLTHFYAAEEEHQDFFAKNPSQAYCQAVAVPKVSKVRKNFSEYFKA